MAARGRARYLPGLGFAALGMPGDLLTFGVDGAIGRETHLREVPIRRVQEARGKDERAAGGQGW
jgi:hypothetical protein